MKVPKKMAVLSTVPEACPQQREQHHGCIDLYRERRERKRGKNEGEKNSKKNEQSSTPKANTKDS